MTRYRRAAAGLRTRARRSAPRPPLFIRRKPA